MNRAYWIAAALGLALVFYLQFSENREPSKVFLVTGMPPQIEVIRQIASDRNWRIVCEGTAGEMTALGVEPGLLADEKWEPAVKQQFLDVASTVSPITNSDCSTDSPTFSTDHPTANPPLAFGDKQSLQPHLKLAMSCGFVEATISPIAEIDRANLFSEVPSDLMALYGGPGSANRYGPAVCIAKMTPRMSA
jgi:hypothetical protein